MKRVTLQDIAEIAGVSRGTVDRVINGRGRVKPEVEKRVRDIAVQLGYSKNVHASRLAQNTVLKVSIILPHSTLPYWQRLAQSFEDSAQLLSQAPIHFEKINFACHQEEDFYLCLQNAVHAEADAIILVPFFDVKTNLFLDQIDTERTKAYSIGMPFQHFALQKNISFAESDFRSVVKKIREIYDQKREKSKLLLHPEDPLHSYYARQSPEELLSIKTIELNEIAEIPEDELLFTSFSPEINKSLFETRKNNVILLDSPNFSNNLPFILGSLDRNPTYQVLAMVKEILRDFGLSNPKAKTETGIDLPYYFK